MSRANTPTGAINATICQHESAFANSREHVPSTRSTSCQHTAKEGPLVKNNQLDVSTGTSQSSIALFPPWGDADFLYFVETLLSLVCMSLGCKIAAESLVEDFTAATFMNTGAIRNTQQHAPRFHHVNCVYQVVQGTTAIVPPVDECSHRKQGMAA
jgi:hypothetical protein